jgi:hypothetical protein
MEETALPSLGSSREEQLSSDGGYH